MPALRLSPYSLVLILIAGASWAADSVPDGRQVYEDACAKCHSGGFGGFFTGAPKTGKQADWAPLLDKGVEALVATTLAGIGKMEARGGCADCSDAQIRAAVEYMVAESR